MMNLASMRRLAFSLFTAMSLASLMASVAFPEASMDWSRPTLARSLSARLQALVSTSLKIPRAFFVFCEWEEASSASPSAHPMRPVGEFGKASHWPNFAQCPSSSVMRDGVGEDSNSSMGGSIRKSIAAKSLRVIEIVAVAPPCSPSGILSRIWWSSAKTISPVLLEPFLSASVA